MPWTARSTARPEKEVQRAWRAVAALQDTAEMTASSSGGLPFPTLSFQYEAGYWPSTTTYLGWAETYLKSTVCI